MARRTTDVQRPVVLIALGSVLGVLSACGNAKTLPFDPGDGRPDPSATFTRVQGEVFSPSCALSDCHSGVLPQAGLDLSAGVAYVQTMGVASTQQSGLNRVEPGDPERSYLVKKLRGDPGISGSRMPLTGTISDGARQLVIDWVRRGAPRD